MRPACLALLFLAAATTTRANTGWEGFDIFTTRPVRIDLAAPGQSATEPIANRGWPALAPADLPGSAEQADRFATSDELALWVPIKNAEPTTGAYSFFAEGGPVVDEQLGRITFDLYRRRNQLVGQAFTGPEERAFWIGVLESGEYEVELRQWDLPDEPLVLSPDDLPLPPWQDSLSDATLREVVAFSFRVGIPEPATFAIAIAMVATIGATRTR